MPERITFKKLLNLVEKETGLDNKKSDKLLRRWFDIIDEGLQRDGRVRISKFGIFKLQSVKERNGINPSTREAMVFPAHTKVVFKSAKHLKEIVNKKYNLLEAKPIIMADKKSEKKIPESDISKKAKTEKKDSDTEINNLISQINESPESDGEELKYVENQEPKKEETKINQIKKKQSEEIRAKIEEKFDKKENDFTPTGVMSAASDKPEEKQSAIKEKTDDKNEVVSEPDKPASENVNVIVQKDKVEKESESPIMQRRLEEEKKSKIGLWIAIAFIILLIIILLFWKPWEEPEDIIVEIPPVKEVVKPEPQKPVVKKKVYKTPGAEHAVSLGDKLWDLSDNYYRDAYLWPNIYRVNDGSIPNPDILIIGNVVTVPPLEGTYQNLTAKDSVNISVGFYKAYKAYKNYGNEWAKYYLWACKKYDRQTFNDKRSNADPEDFQFAITMK